MSKVETFLADEDHALSLLVKTSVSLIVMGAVLTLTAIRAYV